MVGLLPPPAGHILQMGAEMSDPQTALGKRIQGLRQKAGITQQQLAEKADLSIKYLGELERGRANASLSILFNLAAALGVSLPELVEFDFERFSPEQLRKNLHSVIDDATDEDCKLFYRLLRVLAK